jgi:hypothetical protein
MEDDELQLITALDINDEQQDFFIDRTLFASAQFPAVYIHGKVCMMHLRFNTEVNKPGFYDSENEVCINPWVVDDYQFKPATYPQSHIDNYYGLLYAPNRVVGYEGDHVYNYPADFRLSRYDVSANSVTQHEARSYYQGNPTQGVDTASMSDISALVDHLTYEPYYLNLLYDPYRQLYYRFYRGALQEGVDCNNCTFSGKPLSIMILDASLQVVDELYMQESVYEERASFVGPTGLYLSCAHYNNDSLGNGYLSFDLLTLEALPSPRLPEHSSPLALMQEGDNAFYITGNWPGADQPFVSVFDLQGRLLHRDVYQPGEVISLPLAPGVYLVSVADISHAETFRLIIH